MENMILDFSAGTVELTDEAMRLDLGGIAKGYATEMAARALESAGFTGYALSIGGNVRVVGVKYADEPWVSGIQNPDLESDSAFLAKVALKDMSLVTSGSYQRYFELDGYRYHHIIHPETLRPENEFLSVSILSSDSGVADALSTAVFNMSLEDGLFFIRGLPDTEACWILADGSVYYSDGFEEYLVK
jgi:thiamine biosynthesis lipoprotein